MKAAYVDTSCLLAVTLNERGSKAIAKSMSRYDSLLSSNLLEAEFRAALLREKVDVDPTNLLAGISWVHPDRPLTNEITTILKAGYVRGADLWHLAVALFVDPNRQLDFLTLDARQRDISRQLGFGRARTPRRA
jgi:PIN domain nuclease of toxin-antitoxin system